MAAVATPAVSGPKRFEYRARNSTGKAVKGHIEASSQGAVVDKLRGLGLAPVEITEALAGTGLNREISFGHFKKGVDLKSLAVFTRQLATMTSAGLPLIKSLGILTQQTENTTLKAALGNVSREVEGGSSLSEAMAKYPVEFPVLMINMVRAGEIGGFLEGALESVAENFEKEAKLRGEIKSAMMYPAMVLGIAVLAVVVMLIFIVPIFAKMFASAGKSLPVPTQILVVLSNNMLWAGPLTGGLIAFGMVWWRMNKHKDPVRSRVDPIKLRLPVFGKLNKKIAIARFSRNFAKMIAAGVPILQALSIVGETAGNWVIERACKNIADSVRRGRSISAPLAEEEVFPAMVTQMVAVGEDSGALETMLTKIGDFYDAEVEASTKALTSMLEPLMVAFLGVIVGGMVVALYLPIFNMVNAVGG